MSTNLDTKRSYRVGPFVEAPYASMNSREAAHTARTREVHVAGDDPRRFCQINSVVNQQMDDGLARLKATHRIQRLNAPGLQLFILRVTSFRTEARISSLYDCELRFHR